MQPKKSIILVGIVICLNAFYGCAGLKKEPIEKKYFDLNINLPASNQNSISQGTALLVKEFFINSTFDSHSFVYRVGKNEYVTDYYNEFVSYPARLVTEKIEENLYASSLFTPALTNIKQDIDFRLSGKITNLYGDFQDTNDPKAIIEIRMALEKRVDKTFQVISEKTYRSEENISTHAPAHLVSGWNTGLLKIVTQFINDFQTPTP
ncbi:MAG: hypothetical protein K8S13_14830 [Desulfobacula sp.]|uniref:ABC-type transport auxiliary lipoprotein family protein n=1 Tax=Desulfobacula sp. TaxID=2593537 RepID=UPI0025C4ACB8|nr:hypothetical protein [Desulfobacula sp.]MCD4721112.1 hypothetical protein [Desulfobacula sp.]